MGEPSLRAHAISMPGITTIKATRIRPLPAWALLERKLMATMEDAAVLASKKYARPSGLVYYDLDVDDVYESRSMRGLFYAIGADDVLLEIASREWNATTRYYNDGVVRRDDDPLNPMYMPQLHNEYWNLAVPYNSDWFHMGEGNQSFYDFGLADPANPENRRRATRFAAMYIGEDPEAPNYDPQYKIIRSPFHGSEGPLLSSKSKHRLIHTGGKTTGHVELVRAWLDRGSVGDFFHRSPPRDKPSDHPLITTLYPVVKELEPRWYEDPERCEEILKLFDEIVLNGDEPSNLCATALVTNAYLYTGEEKYKKWVLDYVDAWMDRIRANNGIIPDNVGPTGKIGENRQGQWWGGIHGWNSRGATDRMFIVLTVASECATLLSGDPKYLDLMRSQFSLLIDRAKKRDDGQLVVPTRYGPEGWADYTPLRIRDLSHLFHASMDPADRDLIIRLRDGDVEKDWNHVESEGDRRSGNSEMGRFQYYEGQNPEWPMKILMADYQQAMGMYQFMLSDGRTVEQVIEDNRWPPNPVVVKGLTQVTMGCPQTIYNGGLLRAMVRYFDQDRGRPGLPPDVAALVDHLGSESVGIQIVNTNSNETRNVIVQAGAFGEHQFTEVKHANGAEERRVPVDGKYFAVELPPSTAIRVEAGMRRFVNDPSYAFPWHGAKVPVL